MRERKKIKTVNTAMSSCLELQSQSTFFFFLYITRELFRGYSREEEKGSERDRKRERNGVREGEKRRKGDRVREGERRRKRGAPEERTFNFKGSENWAQRPV